MTRAIQSAAPPLDRAPALRWPLRRDTAVITCRVDARGDRSYEVCVLPHGQPSFAVIESYDALAPALVRHAELAASLREDGWMVIDHVAVDGMRAAA